MTTTVSKKTVTVSGSGGGSSIAGSGRRVGGIGSSGISFRSSSQPRAFSSHSMHSYGARPQASLSSRYGRYQAVGSVRGFGGGFGSGSSSSYMSMMPGGSMFNNEKDTMQNLNQRLSIYLEKVQSLETSNSDLERQIREIASSKTIDSFDWSIYNTTVKPLQQQIINSILQNSRIALETDNAKLAAEDFRNKWESELMLRQSVENDIDGLHQLKDTYLQLQGNLANEITGLEDEIAFLKKNHEEELRLLRQQQTQEVQVEVDSIPSIGLTATLKELRDKYSQLADQNRKELDAWYKQQVTIKVTETTQSNQALDAAKGEIGQYRHQMQSLEAEYNSLSGNLSALQNTLIDTEGRYGMEHQQILARVSQLEGELGGIRNDLIRQSEDYQILLNYKMKLEAEIQQYKLLLEGGNQSFIHSGSSSSMSTSGRAASQSSVVTGSSSITTKLVTERVNRY